MATNNNIDDEFFNTPYKYKFEEINLISEKVFKVGGAHQKFDLTNVVSELNLYEHLDKPFITGTLIVNDIDPDVNLINEIHFLGTEKIRIKIRVHTSEPFTITKNFVVTEVLKSVKSNDDNEVIVLHIIEDSAYLSSLIRVRRSYRAKKHDIIKQLAETAGRKVKSITDNLPPGDKLTRVIVPNMTPLEAANWVKDRVTTKNGFPYFLYATLSDDDLRFYDLESMLQGQPLNEGRPHYTYSLNSDQIPLLTNDQGETKPRSNSNTVEDASFVINSYSLERYSDHLNYARKGFTTSKYNFIDTTFGDNLETKFRADKVFSKMVKDNLLRGQSKYPLYDYISEFGGKGIHEYDTREITHFATSRQYNDFFDTEGYHEAKTESDHALKVTAKALRFWLLNSPITIQVPGRNFLRNDVCPTIGNIFRVGFIANRSTVGLPIGEYIDQQKTGDYLGYSARHVFSGERYSVHITMTKLGTPGYGRGTYA